jgi:hypothetical protein
MKPSFRPGRKLLVASLGVAAVSYVACGDSTSGNLVATPYDASSDVAKDAIDEQVSGNLAPPPDAGFDATDGGGDATTDGATDAAADAKGD